MKKTMFADGVVLITISLFLILLILSIADTDDSLISRCREDCIKMNMTMLMISDELQCVCTGEIPMVRSYPWK
jgi:hypothetical protein